MVGVVFDSHLGTFWVRIFLRFGVILRVLLRLGPVLGFCTFNHAELLILCRSERGGTMVSTGFDFYLFAGGRKTGNHVFDFLPTLARDYFPATDNQKFVNTAIESPDYALSNAVSTTFFRDRGAEARTRPCHVQKVKTPLNRHAHKGRRRP